MRKSLLLLLALVLVSFTAGASTPSPGGNAWDTESAPSATAITRSVTVVVKSVEDDRTLVTFDPRTEKELIIQLADDVAVRARKKAEFDGRRKLEFDDLAAGQRLKLVYRAEDGKILEVKVLAQAQA